MKGKAFCNFLFQHGRSGAETEHHPRSGGRQSRPKRPCQRRRRWGGSSPHRRPRRRSNARKGGRAETGKRRTNACKGGRAERWSGGRTSKARAVGATKRRTNERLQRRSVGRSVKQTNTSRSECGEFIHNVDYITRVKPALPLEYN